MVQPRIALLALTALACAHAQETVQPLTGPMQLPYYSRNILDACIADSTCSSLVDASGAGLSRTDELLASAFRTSIGMIAHDWKPEPAPTVCLAVGPFERSQDPPPVVLETVKRSRIAVRPRGACEPVASGGGWVMVLRDSHEAALLLTAPNIGPPAGDTVQISTSYEAAMLWSVTWLCEYVWGGNHWRATKCVVTGIS